MNREFTPQPWPPTKNGEILMPKCLDDPDGMFVKPSDQKDAARHVCGPCPIRMECLVQGYELGDYHGIRGGFTEKERHWFLDRQPRSTPQHIAAIAFASINRHDIVEEYWRRLAAAEGAK